MLLIVSTNIAKGRFHVIAIIIIVIIITIRGDKQVGKKKLLEGFIIIIVVRGGDKTIEAFRVLLLEVNDKQGRAC